MATSTDFDSLDRLSAVQDLYQHLAFDAMSVGTRACIEELDDEVKRATPGANFFQSVLHVDDFVPQQKGIELRVPPGYVTCEVPVVVESFRNLCTQIGIDLRPSAGYVTCMEPVAQLLSSNPGFVFYGVPEAAVVELWLRAEFNIRGIDLLPPHRRPAGYVVTDQMAALVAYERILKIASKRSRGSLRAYADSLYGCNIRRPCEDICSDTSSSLENATNISGTVKSFPVSKAPLQCFLAEAMFLDDKDQFIPLNSIQAGVRLRCVCLVDGSSALKTVAVKAIRCLPPRERDFTTITSCMDWSQLRDEREGLVLSLTTTSDHSVLGRSDCGSSWEAYESKQLDHFRSGAICALDLTDKPSMFREMAISHIARDVRSCHVWEVEVDDISCALVVRMHANRQAELHRFGCVVFGCAPWEKQVVVYKHNRMTLDTEAKKDINSDTGSKCASDPTFDAPPPVSTVYSVINRPHDKDCKAICKAYFKGNCSKGVLCSFCHHEDHANQAFSHRARRRKDSKRQ